MQGIETSKRDRELGVFEKISGNCARISGSMYIIKNQAGFNNALYHYTKIVCGRDWYSRKQIRGMINTFPRKYPCLISLSNDFFERDAIFVDIADSGIFDSIAHAHGIGEMSWIKDA